MVTWDSAEKPLETGILPPGDAGVCGTTVVTITGPVDFSTRFERLFIAFNAGNQ
jgi:hypothetical protein